MDRRLLAEAVRLESTGSGRKEIAEQLGVGYSTLNMALYRLHGEPRRFILPETVHYARVLVEAGYTVKEASRVLDVEYSGLCKHLKQHSTWASEVTNA